MQVGLNYFWISDMIRLSQMKVRTYTLYRFKVKVF